MLPSRLHRSIIIDPSEWIPVYVFPSVLLLSLLGLELTPKQELILHNYGRDGAARCS